MSESIYARPVAPRIIWRPVAATLVFHCLLIYALTLNMTGDHRDRQVRKVVPQVINARLVDVAELQPKKVAAPVAKPAAKPRPKPVQKTRPATKSKPVQKTRPKQVATAKPKAAPKATPKPQPRVEPEPEPRVTEAELAAIARADLARAMAAEEESQATVTAEQMTASYASLIQQTVMKYWSRPPSARNGMEAELAIQLIPGGEVISVSVVRSSGNTAFDRSAINAVQKAGSFPELRQLPTREFEKSFRRFRLLFRPEDLRY